MVIHLTGVIRNVSYTPRFRSGELTKYSLSNFDINQARSYGLIQPDDNDKSIMGYSKWVSPKRTRTYPLARLYNVYHTPKKITIIPVIKDEGQSGDNDRINFITFSWMNLANVFIILAWYDRATNHPSRSGKITAQAFDEIYIRNMIEEIQAYQQTALHWNTMHFQRDFERIFQKATDRYRELGDMLACKMHDAGRNIDLLQQLKDGDSFSLETFKNITLPASLQAAQRETMTTHDLEYLTDGQKGFFSVQNYLGGEYHLTADELIYKHDLLVIQESKNTTRSRFPARSDIQDGLFKLILFTNMDELYLNGNPIRFRTQLKLTGLLSGHVSMPCDDDTLQEFISRNHLSSHEISLLKQLRAETHANPGLTIIVEGNQ